jgi:hypothetical protein
VTRRLPPLVAQLPCLASVPPPRPHPRTDLADMFTDPQRRAFLQNNYGCNGHVSYSPRTCTRLNQKKRRIIQRGYQIEAAVIFSFFQTACPSPRDNIML